MTRVTIRNDFTNLEITVDASKPLTARKIKTWNTKLHAASCMSGDVLGGRGKQADPEAYESLRDRAEQVVATGRDE